MKHLVLALVLLVSTTAFAQLHGPDDETCWTRHQWQEDSVCSCVPIEEEEEDPLPLTSFTKTILTLKEEEV